jgi:hypothetical protein
MRPIAAGAAMIVALALEPARVWAHCDGMDGPVVKAAIKALESGDARPVLIWVQKDGEAEVKAAFAQTLAVRKLGPAIPAADKALETGSAETLVKLLTEATEHGVHAHFQHAVATKNFNKTDVAAGREHVKAYVEFLHYVERVYQAAQGPAEGHVH